VRSWLRDLLPRPAGRTRRRAAGGAGCFSHAALLYHGESEYLAGVGKFVSGAVGRGEPVLVAVPAGRLDLLRDELAAGRDGQVMFADMTRMGQNPAWIIPAVQAFLDRHPGQQVSCVGEPAWPDRSPAELREAIKHEALFNQACSGAAAAALCPYDVGGLPDDVLADAERTHPVLIRQGASQASGSYLGPAGVPDSCRQPLPSPPATASRLDYGGDLRPLRDLVARQAISAGLPEHRVPDLVLAVSEVAANTLRHARGSGTLHVWHTPAEIMCELGDDGWIADPLAGRERPRADRAGGQGLWVVNQVCDLVEVRSGQSGTTARLHMSLGS
jgi:anti-sigma regulatory factor (Ser/Thr protein kinase)